MTEHNDLSRKKVILIMALIQLAFVILAKILDRLW